MNLSTTEPPQERKDYKTLISLKEYHFHPIAFLEQISKEEAISSLL